MFGTSRRKGAPVLFLLGLSLMGTGIGWDVTPLWIAGLVFFVLGIALLWRRRREFSVY